MSESSIIKTIKKVMPAVVSIVISKHLEEIEKEIPIELWPFLPPGAPHQLQIPKEDIDSKGMVKIGGGSGFFADPDGIIVTNKHVVIDPNAEYTIFTNENKKYKAEILARDPIEDVAILKISHSAGEKFPIVKLGDSSRLELGETVLAIGNALGLFKNTVSAGIVSGLSRAIKAAIDIKSPIQEMRGLIQTDAAINPGNSGGPLVNLKSEAIGINAAVVLGAQNLNFAIPINAAKRDLEDLKKHGHIRRPLLGVRYISIDDNLKEKLKLPVNYGALIICEGNLCPAVVPGSPAYKAGLKIKDIIIECNGKMVSSEKTIQDFLENLCVGDALKLKVLRGKETFETTITLAERK